MASLFISYSRKDIDFARKLTGAFNDQDLDFWIDWEGIPPTRDWWQEIEKGIEEADIFLFLLGPDSAKSEVCNQEIEHAVQNGKRLIPVVVRDIKADESPSQLRALNWIFLREGDNFDAGFIKLITAIKTDYEWVQIHRQLQVKALEWERNNRENSFLLRGTELKDAELQLVKNSSKEPHPTELHQEYVLKSRRSTDRQRRITTGVAIGVGIALAVLAVTATVQANRATNSAIEAQNQAATAQAASTLATDNQRIAEEQKQIAIERASIARAGELAAQSISVRDSQLDLSSLLGVEAFNTWDFFRTRSVLANNLNTNPQLVQFMFNHNGWVSTVDFNPKTNILASGGCSKWVDLTCDEGEIVFWSIPNGKLNKITSIRAHSSTIISLAFNPEGTILATEGCSHFEESKCSEVEILFWNMENYQQIGKPLQGQIGEANVLDFSPDGKLLASGGCATYELSACIEGKILLWDVDSHSQLGEPILGHNTWVTDLAFSPDGHLVASSSGDGDILIWEVQQGQFTGPILSIGPGSEIIISLEFSPDGKTVVTGGTDNRIRLRDVINGQLILELDHDEDIYAVAFRPDGKLLASGSADGSLTLWDPESGNTINTLLAHTGIVTSLVFTADGKYLASTGEDGRVILWNVEDNVPLGNDIYNGPYLGNPSFSAGRDIVASVFDGTAETINVSDLKGNIQVQNPVKDFPENVDAWTLSSENKLLAMGGENFINLWNFETGKYALFKTLTGHSGFVTAMAFSQDEKIFASGGCQNRDENLVCRSGIIYLWDVDSGEMIGDPIISHTSWVTGLAFSPNGKTLASGSTDDSILLLDLVTKEIIGIPFLGHNQKVTSIAFSPDGKMLASGGQDLRIILWDVPTHQPITKFNPYGYNVVTTLAFSSNGDYLVSGDIDGNIMLWEVSPNRWKLATCQRIGRNFTQEEWAFYFPGETYRITCPQWPAGE